MMKLAVPRLPYRRPPILNSLQQVPQALRERDVQRVRSNTVIFHYNGRGKPWREAYWGRMAWLFWEYAMDIPEYAARYEEVTKKQAAFKKKYAAQKAAYTRKRNREKAQRMKEEIT